MSGFVVTDTSPLVAALLRRERHHAWTKEQLAALSPPLITCEPVLTEAIYLLRTNRAAVGALFAFMRRGLLEIRFSLSSELSAVHALLRKYATVPMSLADACLVRMAELHAGSTVLTLDQDFRVYRKHGRQVIPVLMPWQQ